MVSKDSLFSFIRGSRKAQAAGAAAVLVLFIMIFMIGYVVIIEPEERAALLGEDFDSSSDSDSETDGDDLDIDGEILLEEEPGQIDFLSLDEVEHTLASVNVFTSTESVLLAEKASLYLKNSLFSEEKGSFTFALDDADITSDVILSFLVSQSTEGKLKVSLNGEELVHEELLSGKNINVDISDSLLESQNTLEFTVSGTGAAFWKSNQASIENVKVVGQVEDLSSQRATGTFQISETEFENMESLEFKFQPDCAPSEDGKLSISLNGEDIYSATPNCDVKMDAIELSTDAVRIGQNTVDFFTESGDYTLYGIKVVSELEEIEYPTYYFRLTLEEFESIEDGDELVELTLKFSDEGDIKRGYVSINGYKRSFDTTAGTYAFDISEYVETGNNAITVIPSRTIDVRELTVEMG